MLITCDGLDLCDAVLTVSRAINNKAANPVLEGIKLSAEEETLTLTATDLELSIQKKIKAEVKQEGQIVIPGRFFSEFVRKLANEKIELKTLDNGSLKVRYTDSETVVQILDADEFPDFKALDNAQNFTISQKNLKNLINKTIFAVAVDDTRPILKGCLLEIEENSIQAVALDGYRLALNRAEIKNSNFTTNIIIPARSLSEISKLLEDTEAEISVSVQKNFMMVDINGTMINTRLLQGDFINYKQILNLSQDTVVTINKKQFEDALERASLLSKMGQNNLVQFDIRDQNLCITSKSEIGNINENISIVFKGKELTIAFNARYFIEALRANNDEFVNLNFKEAQNPCLITSIGESRDYIFLILPVRLINRS